MLAFNPRLADNMPPARLQSFAEAYAPAVMAAALDLAPHLCGRTADEYALDTTLAMLDQIERAGVHGVSDYIINTRGGAFRRTCDALGLDTTNPARALQDYLDAKE